MPLRLRTVFALLGLLACTTGCGGEEPAWGGQTRSSWCATLADKTKSNEQRRAAADALGAIAAAHDEDDHVAAALAAARSSDADEEVRRRAVVALAACGTEGLPHLEAALDDASPRVVATALAMIGSLGPRAVKAAPAVAKRLAAGPGIALQAAEALAQMGPAVVPILAPHLRDERTAVRGFALSALVRADPDGVAARDLLVAALADSDWTVRRDAAAALGPHAAKDAGVRTALERALADGNPFVVAAAARAAAEGGPALAPILPRLLPLLASDQGPVRAGAAQAVGRLGAKDPAARAAVEQALTSETGAARVPLWLARWRLTGEAAPSVEGLRGVLREPNPEAAAGAAGALAEMGSAAAPAVPELVALLGSRAVRLRAVEALIAIGPEAAAARPALEAQRSDPNAPYRTRVEEALKRLSAQAGPKK